MHLHWHGHLHLHWHFGSPSGPKTNRKRTQNGPKINPKWVRPAWIGPGRAKSGSDPIFGGSMCKSNTFCRVKRTSQQSRPHRDSAQPTAPHRRATPFSINLSIHLISSSLSIDLSIYRSIDRSIYLSIYLPTDTISLRLIWSLRGERRVRQNTKNVRD